MAKNPGPIIQIKDLKFSWKKDTTAVLDIAEFNVVAGERLFLRGPSGSGKTTLLSVIAAVLSPQSGTAEDEAHRLLEAMQLPDSLSNQSVTELSVGQQQRVAVARALIGQPELIIADEPTSALDTDTRQAFLDLLFAEVTAANSTLLFVSHDTDLSNRFDRVLDLEDINNAAHPRDNLQQVMC